jgi:TolA-binding protein
MASPSNASEPESPEEEEIIHAGFDPLLFWDQYRQVVLVAGGVILLGLAIFGTYEFNQSRTVAAAGAALSQASTEDDYSQIIAKYPGSIAAGDASLLLAGKLRDEKKYDEAVQVLQTFLDKSPTHPLAHAGDLSIAETLEAQGKTDDAIAKYQEVAAKYPDTYSAPLALLAQANAYKSEGKTEDARRAYENFVAQFPDSIFAQQAMGEMKMLRAAPGAAATGSPSATNADVPASLLDSIQAAAAHASSSPAASAAPSAAPTPATPMMPMVHSGMPH